MSIRSSGLCVGFFLLTWAVLARQGECPNVYLCLSDSVVVKNPVQIPVYGYINGKKTECMSREAFYSLYAESMLAKDSSLSDLRRKDSLVLLRKQTFVASLDTMSIMKAITKGKKDLSGLDFSSFDLQGTDFSNADLKNASLKNCDLRASNLSNADLRNAILTGAYVKGADLQNADLRNANLKGTYFIDCDLRGVRGLSAEAISAARTFYQCRVDTAIGDLLSNSYVSKTRDPGWDWRNDESPDTTGKKKSR